MWSEDMRLTRRQSIMAALAGSTMALTPRAFAAGEGSYKGKSIDLIIGFPPGGSNDFYSRALVAHLPQYITDTPTIIPRNMPGAGSLSAAAHMYSIAPKDGTSIAIMAPTIPLDERLGTVAGRFKSSEFGWIGRANSLVNVIFVRSESIANIDEAFTKSVRLAATGAGSAVTIFPNSLNKIMGTRFDLIKGYGGSAEGMLAVDRGEVEGHCTGWDTLKASHPDWLKSGKIRILVQFAAQRHPELPDVPTAVELAKTDHDRALLTAIVNASEIGISFFTTPGAPADRLATLRTAFSACMKDAGFKSDLAKLTLGLNPLSGEDVAARVADVAKVPDSLIPDLKNAYSSA
ncbi:MAG: tripartite tricarboxylate transporter family receptor [Rhizobium sp.]|jgi:tripartite-type tricarboxylate transporter receptor subunit TctC|nr:tripartite tricarboxylate transporter family receptor [Rhizobium sp.]